MSVQTRDAVKRSGVRWLLRSRDALRSPNTSPPTGVHVVGTTCKGGICTGVKQGDKV